MSYCFFRMLSLISFISIAFPVGTIHAQNAPAHDIKYLSLTVGVPYDEPIPMVPESFGKSGTYNKITRLQYNTESKELRFDPRNEGVGTLIITDPNTSRILYEFRIDVKKTNLYKIAREMQSLLGDIEGIAIRVINNKIIVDGQILLPKDMNRIHSVVKQYGNQAASLVTLSPIAQNKIAQFIEKAINNPEITVKAINGKFILEGFAKDKDERDRAEIIAKAYVPDVVVDEAVADKKVLERKADIVINLLAIKEAPPPEPSKIIQLVIHYVELQNDYTKGFRFQWTPDIGDGSTMTFSTGGRNQGGAIATLTGTIRNLLPKLNWAKEHGFARVLQSSSLIVEDGKQGILNSTSRIPYPNVNKDGNQSTAFEETGIKSNITPQVLGARSDSVKLSMTFAVKALVSYTEAGPLTSSREIQTTIVVRSGQSAAVGGLISKDTGTGYNRLPADASRNPIISLYASKDFRKSQSQFMVFVTPIIKASASSGTDKIKQKFRLNN